ncbi:MAG: hypothetical protein A2137_00765 [Chloroflexi bacterium RBG_16_58_8]|nr:MAG: hypothetical protein A2137_00765 [Chloroflexi bacterium RBG_16_58_8]
MKDAHQLFLQVFPAVKGVEKLAEVARVKLDGYGVDSKIATGEVVFDGARPDGWQRPRPGVGLGAGGGEIGGAVAPS